jgi:hypothetical protein
MEKKELTINYSNSGVKTLNGLAVFFVIASVISGITLLVGFFMWVGNLDGYSSSRETAAIGLAIFHSSIFSFLLSIALSAICFGFSSVARTALYKRALIEQDYDIVE